MGIGREVADAYIDVHGDLKSFRGDLEGAREAGRDAGVEAGDSFADGFEKRGKSEMLKRWNGILDTLYDSGDKFDFSRLLDDTSLDGLNASLEKVRDTLAKFNEADKLDDDLFIKADDALKSQVEALRDIITLDEQHAAAIAENNRLEQLHADAIRENTKLKKLEAEQERQAAEWRKAVTDAEDAQHAEAIRMNRQKNQEELDFQKAVAEAAKARHEEALRMNDEWNARRRKTFEEALAENEKWKRSFEGIRKMADISGLEQDFKKLSTAMDDASISKFMKGFDSFDAMRARVIAVTDAMKEQGRISEDNAAAMHARVSQWISDREAELALEQEALDRARELRDAQDRYRQSLDGMVDAAHFKKVESDFRDLTDAIGTADFSKFARGADNVQDFRDRVIESAFHMKAFGKIGAEEFGHIIDHLDKVTLNLEGFNVKLGNSGSKGRDAGIKITSGLSAAGAAAQSMGDKVEGLNPKMFSIVGLAKSLAGHMAGTVKHFQGLAGLNVMGDMVQQGLDIAQNIDRVSLAMGQAALKLGSAASIVISAAGGLVNVLADVGSMAGIAWLAPGFLAAAGIQIGVLVAAFKDMKTKLKDLTPEFQKLQDNISNAFWKQAEQPVRNLVKSLMPTLQTQLSNTATSLGNMFGALADGFTKSATPAKVEGMFKKMNGAIDVAKGAMGPLADAFVKLGEHASDYFGRFAQWIVNLSTDFDDFVSAAAKDGRLKQWTEDAIDAFKDAGRAIGGVFEIFQGLNQAAEDAGLGGLKQFADGLERMADIAKSPDFQQALTTYFEGAKAGADSIYSAINDRLFPALGNIAPTISTAMDIIGEAMGRAIGYLSDIIENPNVQQGILDLSNGVNNAMTTMQDAVGPIGDSLGSLLDISGHILENLSKVFTTFMINISPEVDKIGRKFEELADPLTGAVQSAIQDITPLIESLRLNVVNPLVDGVKLIIPEIQDFVSKATPILTQITDKVGPVLGTLVKDVLPQMVSFASQLATSVILPTIKGLVDLLTPAFGQALKEVGAGFKNAAEGLKALHGEANTFDLLPQFKDMHDKVDTDWKATWGQPSNNTFWEDLGKVLFGGNLVDVGQRMLESWGDDLTGFFGDFGKNIGDGWQRVFSGNIFGDQPGKWFKEVGEFFSGDGDDKLDDTVNQWFEDNLVNPLKKGWDDAWNGLKGWYEDVKSNFQDFMSDLLGFNTSPGDEASVSVAGGHGMAVGGKITPEMLGLGTPEDNWLDSLNTKVNTSLGEFWNGVGENIGALGQVVTDAWNSFWSGFGTGIADIWTGITETLATWWSTITTNLGTWLAGLGEGWNGFWSGFGTTIGEIWTGITTTLATWWTTITTNLSTWFGQVKMGWDTFWATLPQKVSEVWTQITTWIATQVTTISTNISNFITTVRTNWDGFWNTVNQKVQQIWQQITQWIGTQVTTIQTNISNFITTVRTNWDSFWNTVNQKVQTIWSTIVGWIGSKAAEIRGKIDSMISTVKTNWENFWSTINQKVTEWWGKIVTGVQTGITNVVTEAGTLVSKATNAVGDTIGALLQKGKDFAQGFINGISSMVGDIAAAAASFVQSAIDAATNQQDSHSPSRVTRGLGHDYGDGYVLGVKDRFDAAQTAAEGLVGAALSGLSTSRMYSAGVEAALGLADGLKSQGSLMENTLSAMIPDLQAQITASGSGFGAAPVDGSLAPAGKTVIFQEGAVQVDSKASNPGVVASMVIDDIADIFDSSDT